MFLSEKDKSLRKIQGFFGGWSLTLLGCVCVCVCTYIEINWNIYIYMCMCVCIFYIMERERERARRDDAFLAWTLVGCMYRQTIHVYIILYTCTYASLLVVYVGGLVC